MSYRAVIVCSIFLGTAIAFQSGCNNRPPEPTGAPVPESTEPIGTEVPFGTTTQVPVESTTTPQNP